MINEGMKNLAAGANPIILRKGMKKLKVSLFHSFTKDDWVVPAAKFFVDHSLSGL